MPHHQIEYSITNFHKDYARTMPHTIKTGRHTGPSKLAWLYHKVGENTATWQVTTSCTALTTKHIAS